MQKIATGSLHERVLSAGLGEIDVLSASFNTMAENLEERTAELTEEVDQRKRAEDQMRYHAYHDALTGLPNRRSSRIASQRLAQARRSRQMVGVMFLDLNRFKLVNDTLGHVIGDQLLQAIAKRLAGLVREETRSRAWAVMSSRC
jgi:GGDEF domain-containing protein